VIARNPYVIGVPLTDDTAFYGRQEVFEFIKDVLDAEKQNVIVLYGQRRIGKTSVLHRGARWLQERGRFFPVYYDLQGKSGLRLGEVLSNLAQTLARRLNVPEPDSALFDDDGRYFGERFLPLAFTHLDGRRLVLLIDEFDVLGDELASPDAASETLFPYLQALIVNQPQIGFVFVVGRRIEELATHFQAIFKQAVYRRVGHLKPEESNALIVGAARGMVTYDEDAVRGIHSLAAGHPYFTQLLCFEAFNAVRANGSPRVTAQVVEDVVTRAIESGHGALNWFWEGLPRAERFILSAIAQVSDASGMATKDDVRRLLEDHRILLSGLELKDAPDRLVEWEMLRRSGPDAYQFVVELVRRWVVQERPLSSARRDIDYVNKRAVRLFENAREAHSEDDLPYARDEYRRALKANPNHSGAQLGVALVLYELGELDEAISEFERAYAIDEMSARDGLIRARLARAKKLEDGALPDAAVLEYEQVIRLAPAEETAVRRLTTIWLGRADAALANDDLGAARDAFRRVLAHDSRRDAAARMQTALTMHAEGAAARGNLEHAAAAFSLLLELIPDDQALKAQAAGFLFRCGDGLETRGQLDQAVPLYIRVAELCPADDVVAARLDSARRKLDERQTVARIFERATAAHHSGRMDEARDGWKELIQKDVLSYQGQNIAMMLAETIAAAVPPPPVRQPEPEPAAVVRETTVQQVEIPAPRPVSRIPEVPAENSRATAVVESDQRRQQAPPRVLPEASAPEDVGVGESKAEVAPDERHAFARNRKILAGFAVVIAPIALFLLWPISPSGIDLTYYGGEIERQQTVRLFASPIYVNDWSRRNPTWLSETDYTWTSSNDAVARVDRYGVVKGLAPGTARITASWWYLSDSIEITVLPWDLPAMKADVTAIQFYAGLSAQAPQERKYQSEFDSRTPGFIWAELTLDVEEAYKDRAPGAPIAYTLYRADNSVVEDRSLGIGPYPPEWVGVIQPVVLFVNARREPGSYRIEFKHDGQVIGTAQFSVR
jgi:tetratricopeptide (TPR) repeat protein